MAIDVAALAAHLNLTADEADALDATALPRLLSAARAHTEADLGFPLTDAAEFPAGPPADVEQAVLMLAAHWFAQREATIVGVSVQSVPLGYAEILANHRKWSFG